MNRPIIATVGNVISTYSVLPIIKKFGPENLVVQPQILLLYHTVFVCVCVYVAGSGEVGSGGVGLGAGSGGGRGVLLKLSTLNQRIQLTGCSTSHYQV
jgi:hypothetical protein